jgi:hypothetical protein
MRAQFYERPDGLKTSLPVERELSTGRFSGGACSFFQIGVSTRKTAVLSEAEPQARTNPKPDHRCKGCYRARIAPTDKDVLAMSQVAKAVTARGSHLVPQKCRRQRARLSVKTSTHCDLVAYKLLPFRRMIPVRNVFSPCRSVKFAWLPALIVISLFNAVHAPAATIPVFPGQSIQAAINGGTAGDTVVIFEGTYNEDITVSKLVQLAKPQDAKVVLGGNLTLSGLNSPYVLHDFTIGADRSKRVTVQNCSDVILQDLNLSSSAGFTATNTPKFTVLRVDNTGGTGSSVTDSAKFETKHCRIDSTLNLSKSNSILRQGTYGTVASDQGDFYLLGGTVSSLSTTNTVKSGASGTGDSTSVIFQSTIAGAFSSSVQKNWIGYSTIRNLEISAGASHLIVGNDFDGKKSNYGVRADVAIALSGTSKNIRILNNVIRNYGAGNYETTYGTGVTVSTSAGACTVLNNIFSTINSGGSGYWGTQGGVGVFVDGTRNESNPVVIRGNIFERMSEFAGNRNNCIVIKGEFPNITVSDNAIHKFNGTNSGKDNGAPGVVATNTIELSAPVDWEPGTFFKLPSTSPLKNKGPNDARFNNFDGTRNDLGIWGGTQFDPDGRTTTKPVVFGFDITPDQILEGTATQVKLMNIGAVMIEP